MHNNRFYIVCFLLWIIAGAVSLFFFIKREQFGNYFPRSTYKELYPEDRLDAKWTKSSTQYSEEEKAHGKKLSAMEAGIDENESTLSKTIKIEKWLLKSFWNCPSGVPLDSLNRLRPLQSYKGTAMMHTPVWCGTYGSLFLFFCNCNNITCRYIESSGGPDHHVINECYIPEIKKWILTDLTHKIINTTDEKGNYLNAADIMKMNKENRSKNIIVQYMKDTATTSSVSADSVLTQWSQYLGEKNSLSYYYLIDLKKVYATGQKIKRYLLPESWYEIYGDKKKSNALFFIRSSFALIWILLSIFMAAILLKHKREN